MFGIYFEKLKTKLFFIPINSFSDYFLIEFLEKKIKYLNI